VTVYSGIAFQLAHCIVSLKNLTAASVSSSVLRGTFRVSLSLIRCISHPNLCVYCIDLVVSLGLVLVLLVLLGLGTDRRIGQSMTLLWRSLGGYPS
jgi:hypothetical protein